MLVYVNTYRHLRERPSVHAHNHIPRQISKIMKIVLIFFYNGS